KLNELEAPLDNLASLLQSQRFDVQYDQVSRYVSNDETAAYGVTVSNYSTTKDVDDSGESSYAGGGKWTPTRVFPLYDWNHGGSREDGNTTPTSENTDWVAIDPVNFTPRMGEDNWNSLTFDPGEKYFVMTSTPGYLFWVHFNAGRWDVGDGLSEQHDKCALLASLQHPVDAAPPYIQGPCPGDYGDNEVFCGEVAFEDQPVAGWYFEHGDDDSNCEEPGEMLIFCPSDEGEIVDASDNAYNPWSSWESDHTHDWRGSCQDHSLDDYDGAPDCSNVASKFVYSLQNEDAWEPTALPWYGPCYPVFGGSAPDEDGDYQTSLETYEALKWSNDVRSCVDVEPANGQCDLVERAEMVGSDKFIVGKEIPAYKLGQVQRVDEYDNNENVVRSTVNDWLYLPYSDSEEGGYLPGQGVFIGTSRLVGSSLSQDGLSGVMQSQYSDFDRYLGEPMSVRTSDASGSCQLVEKSYAYAYSDVTLDGSSDDWPFKGSFLHMFDLPKEESVSDCSTGEDVLVKRTKYGYEQGWCAPLFSDNCDVSAQTAWLPSQVREQRGSDDLVTVQDVKAYDRYFNPLVVADGLNHEVIYRYGSNDDPCGLSGVGNYSGHNDYLFVSESEFGSGLLTCVENDLGHRSIFGYDTTRRLTEIQDANGVTTTYGYNAHGRLSTVDLPDTGSDTLAIDLAYGYDESSNADYTVSTVSTTHYFGDARSHITSAQSDGFGRVVQKTTGLGDGQSLIENSFYHCQHYATCNGRGELEGSSQIFAAAVADASSFAISHYTLDPSSAALTAYEANPLGRVAETTRIGGGIGSVSTAYSYGSLDSFLSTTVQDAQQKSDGVGENVALNDGFGRVVQTLDASSASTSFERDYFENIVEITDAQGRVIARNDYDQQQHLTSSCHRDSGWDGSACADWECGCASFEYDNAGNLTDSYIAQGDGTSSIHVEHQYDNLNRLINVSYDDGTQTVTYDYDVSDGNACAYSAQPTLTRECQLGDANNDGFVNVADLTRMGQCMNPELADEDCYDDDGEIKHCSMDLNGDGNVLAYDIYILAYIVVGSQADELPTSYTVGDGELMSSLGRLCSVSNGDVSDYDFWYDQRGRTVQTSFRGADDLVSTRFYTYDNMDRLEKVYRSSGEGALLDREYGYDDGGRLSWVEIGGHRSYFYYDEHNRLERIWYSSGVQQNFEYNAFSELNRSHLTQLQEGSFNESYDYDLVGNVVRISDDTGTEAEAVFDYDLTYRLSDVSHTQEYYGDSFSSIAYGYDVVGNRIWRDVSGGDDTLVWDEGSEGSAGYVYAGSSNRLLETVGEGCFYDYDARGNVVSVGGETEGSACVGHALRMDYTYNAKNQLTGFSGVNRDSTAVNGSFAYDGYGRRVAKTVNGLSTFYVYDHFGHVVETHDGQGNHRYYYYVGDKLFAQSTGSGLSYVHQDWLGNNRVVTDLMGEVTSSFQSLPFGQQVSAGDLRFGFSPNKELDETGLYNFEARYYDASLGRFTSVDPLWMDDSSRSSYIYARNNPLKFIDPDGKRASKNEAFGPLTTDLLKSQMKRLKIPQKDQQASHPPQSPVSPAGRPS
ncbi:MAG: RHS repeat-associated core domain-containing protein, partial [Myxococcota bacterium]|nr:RHS repeat-associated core domain-containing protein [Myxococcota bacterium]